MLLLSPIAYLFFRSLTKDVKNLASQILEKKNGKKIFYHLEDLLTDVRTVIDELKKRIDDISRERDFIYLLLERLTDAILIVDSKGTIRKTNRAFEELFQLPESRKSLSLIEAIRSVELERTFKEVISSGDSKTIEISLAFPKKRTFEVNLIPIKLRQDEKEEKESLSSVLIVFHEITRLKELERMRSDFVANVSHELRTPLTAIKAYTETLLGGALKEEVAHKFLEVIKRHADRLERIVDDLLMLSKIEFEEFQWNREILPLGDLVEGVLQLFRDSFEKKKMKVILNPVPERLKVYGDRKYLEQVLFNLLDNALKYGRENGTVIVSVVERDKKEAEISVKDDGIGIPREDLPRIFERFYRVDKGRSRELGGTGLGLSIVKHIVQAHGGRVWAESTPGKGSTFYFTLPLANF